MYKQQRVFKKNNKKGQQKNKSLYLDSVKLGNKILRSLKNKSDIYKNVISELSNGATTITVGINNADAVVLQTEELIKLLCESISPYFALPALLHAINNYYYGQEVQLQLEHTNEPELEPIWLGTSLKGALAYIAGNVYTKAHVTPHNLLYKISEVVQAFSFLDQLKVTKMHLDVYAQDGDYITYNSEGVFDASTRLNELRYGHNLTYEKRGMNHRTLDTGSKVLWVNMTDAHAAITNVVNGANPKDQKIFTNTLFADVPSSSEEFWKGLLIRFTCAVEALVSNCSGSISTDCISIVNRFDPPPMLLEGFQRGATRATDEELNLLRWDQKWSSERVKDEPQNMLVDRPYVLINEDRGVYVASFWLICDTLNQFVESSVMNYRDRNGVPLPQSIFRKYVSEPFENDVNSLFRKYKFKAASVKESGFWNLPENPQLLIGRDKSKIPGEIDSLAYNEELGVAFIIECKVLQYPLTSNSARNLLGKIGIMDDDEYRKKVLAKAKWVAETSYFSSVSPDRLYSMVILDRYLPGMIHDNKFWCANTDLLEHVLQILLEDKSKLRNITDDLVQEGSMPYLLIEIVDEQENTSVAS